MRVIETVVRRIARKESNPPAHVPRRLRPRASRSTFVPMVDHELIRGMALVS